MKTQTMSPPDVDDDTFQKMKEWLGQGEMDIDLALRMGATTRENVIEICRTLIDSPWFVEPLA